MKNILIAFGIVVTVALLFVAVSKAETPERITIINSGKAGGSFNARTQMYKEGLTAAGYDVRYENVGKISQAVKMFKASDEPTIMVYANNQVYKQDLFHTENNFILAEYQQPLYVCRTNASKGKVTNLTVAHGKGFDPELLTTILGNNITLVPYKNSGAMLKGMLGGRGHDGEQSRQELQVHSIGERIMQTIDCIANDGSYCDWKEHRHQQIEKYSV